jgi:hypothetical protein
VSLYQELEAVGKAIAAVLAVGGGGAVIAYFTFQWLGKTWLEQKFAKQLEQFKHERNKEIERVRHEINSLYSRISKVHEKEFEVLPKAWELLHRANGATFQLVKALREDADVARMSDPQLAEFLDHSVFAEFKKNEIRAATGQERESIYQEAVFWREWNDATNAQKELNNYLSLNSIFMTKALREQFRAINLALVRINITEEAFHGQHHTAEMRKTISQDLDKVGKLFEQIEVEVQKRLRYEDA